MGHSTRKRLQGPADQGMGMGMNMDERMTWASPMRPARYISDPSTLYDPVISSALWKFPYLPPPCPFVARRLTTIAWDNNTTPLNLYTPTCG